MKPYEERKARERQVAAGTANITGKLPPIGGDREDAGRTAAKLAEEANKPLQRAPARTRTKR